MNIHNIININDININISLNYCAEMEDENFDINTNELDINTNEDDIKIRFEEKTFKQTCKNFDRLEKYCKRNLLHFLENVRDFEILLKLEMDNSRFK